MIKHRNNTCKGDNNCMANVLIDFHYWDIYSVIAFGSVILNTYFLFKKLIKPYSYVLNSLIALIITIVNTYQSAILVDEFGLSGNVLFIFLILAEIIITILALKIYNKNRP